MGNASIHMKDPDKDETDMADLSSMTNLLPAELSTRPAVQALPLRVQLASLVLMPLSGHALDSIPAPPHTSAPTTTTTTTATATATAMPSTTSSMATPAGLGASTCHPPPVSTPKSPGEMISKEMGTQLREILVLPREVIQQCFPWIFEHLASFMASKQAPPCNSEVEPDPPSDAELGPYEEKEDGLSELLDKYPNWAPWEDKGDGCGNSSSCSNGGSQGKQGGGRGGGQGGS
ncbi:hypothetical protein FRC10_000605 [Ceratobasidium sp. 414]|nr:hypothetical protein FRC10_000605 [Ceratobasidium sp. 414]